MEQNFKNILLVFFGGGLGSLVRFFLSNRLNQNLPYGTFITNILGCLIIGFVFGLYEKNIVENQTKLFIAVGFCGGFTTFSSFILEKYQMLSRGEFINVFLYFSFSIFLGLIALFLGIYLSKIK